MARKILFVLGIIVVIGNLLGVTGIIFLSGIHYAILNILLLIVFIIMVFFIEKKEDN